MTDFLKRYFNLSPSQITRVYVVLSILGIVTLTIIFSKLTEKEQVVRSKPPIESLLTTKNTREIGLNAVNQKVMGIEKDNSDITKKLDIIHIENEKILKKSQAAREIASDLASTKKELEDLKVELKKEKNKSKQNIQDAIEAALLKFKNSNELSQKDKPLVADSLLNKKESKPELPHVKRKKSPSDSVFNYGSSSKGKKKKGNEKSNSNSEVKQTVSTGGRAASLFQVVEDQTVAVKEEEEALYLPSGSILSGVLITGLDAPTASDAVDSPVPVLVRVKKEAILPNFTYIDEVRECFALMAGYGDMASERVYLRGEGVSCVKENGEVIETNFSSYAVGEDGKAGLKGTLVTRNSTVLANAMMAGFASGLSSAFDVNPVATFSTDTTGTQQYQDVFNSSAAQGGLASGASSAAEKLADYYLDLADQIHPIIEVGAGRFLDIIITKGTSL